MTAEGAAALIAAEVLPEAWQKALARPMTLTGMDVVDARVVRPWFSSVREVGRRRAWLPCRRWARQTTTTILCAQRPSSLLDPVQSDALRLQGDGLGLQGGGLRRLCDAIWLRRGVSDWSLSLQLVSLERNTRQRCSSLRLSPCLKV